MPQEVEWAQYAVALQVSKKRRTVAGRSPHGDACLQCWETAQVAFPHKTWPAIAELAQSSSEWRDAYQTCTKVRLGLAPRSFRAESVVGHSSLDLKIERSFLGFTKAEFLSTFEADPTGMEVPSVALPIEGSGSQSVQLWLVQNPDEPPRRVIMTTSHGQIHHEHLMSPETQLYSEQGTDQFRWLAQAVGSKRPSVLGGTGRGEAPTPDAIRQMVTQTRSAKAAAAALEEIRRESRQGKAPGSSGSSEEDEAAALTVVEGMVGHQAPLALGAPQRKRGAAAAALSLKARTKAGKRSLKRRSSGEGAATPKRRKKALAAAALQKQPALSVAALVEQLDLAAIMDEQLESKQLGYATRGAALRQEALAAAGQRADARRLREHLEVVAVAVNFTAARVKTLPEDELAKHMQILAEAGAQFPTSVAMALVERAVLAEPLAVADFLATLWPWPPQHIRGEAGLRENFDPFRPRLSLIPCGLADRVVAFEEWTVNHIMDLMERGEEAGEELLELCSTVLQQLEECEKGQGEGDAGTISTCCKALAAVLGGALSSADVDAIQNATTGPKKSISLVWAKSRWWKGQVQRFWKLSLAESEQLPTLQKYAELLAGGASVQVVEEVLELLPTWRAELLPGRTAGVEGMVANFIFKETERLEAQRVPAPTSGDPALTRAPGHSAVAEAGMFADLLQRASVAFPTGPNHRDIQEALARVSAFAEELQMQERVAQAVGAASSVLAAARAVACFGSAAAHSALVEEGGDAEDGAAEVAVPAEGDKDEDAEDGAAEDAAPVEEGGDAEDAAAEDAEPVEEGGDAEDVAAEAASPAAKGSAEEGGDGGGEPAEADAQEEVACGAAWLGSLAWAACPQEVSRLEEEVQLFWNALELCAGLRVSEEDVHVLLQAIEATLALASLDGSPHGLVESALCAFRAAGRLAEGSAVAFAHIDVVAGVMRQGVALSNAVANRDEHSEGAAVALQRWESCETAASGASRLLAQAKARFHAAAEQVKNSREVAATQRLAGAADALRAAMRALRPLAWGSADGPWKDTLPQNPPWTSVRQLLEQTLLLQDDTQLSERYKATKAAMERLAAQRQAFRGPSGPSASQLEELLAQGEDLLRLSHITVAETVMAANVLAPSPLAVRAIQKQVATLDKRKIAVSALQPLLWTRAKVLLAGGSG